MEHVLTQPIEFLTEKGILTGEEVLERIKKTEERNAVTPPTDAINKYLTLNCPG